MISNAKKEAGVINPESGLPLELDLYLPSLNLAFEYQVRTAVIEDNVVSSLCDSGETSFHIL